MTMLKTAGQILEVLRGSGHPQLNIQDIRLYQYDSRCAGTKFSIVILAENSSDLGADQRDHRNRIMGQLINTTEKVFDNDEQPMEIDPYVYP